jgi:hypothetical protein
MDQDGTPVCVSALHEKAQLLFLPMLPTAALLCDMLPFYNQDATAANECFHHKY